jgi:hypothetical protein
VDAVGRRAALTLSAATRRRGADMAWCAFESDDDASGLRTENFRRKALEKGASAPLASLPLPLPLPLIPGRETHPSTRALDSRAPDPGQRYALVRIRRRTT